MSIEHEFDGHGGHAPGCPGCEIERLTARATEAERANADSRALVAHLQSELAAEVDALKRAEQQLAEARAEVSEMRRNYEGACQTLVLMHEAATGRKGEGPRRGVVEDCADVQQRIVVLTAEVNVLRGVGCREAKQDEPESGPCGVCVKCYRERIATLTAENRRLSRRVNALEDAMNGQDVSDIDAALTGEPEAGQ